MISALRVMPDQSHVTVRCSAELVVRQLRREWRIRQPRLRELSSIVDGMIDQKRVQVRFVVVDSSL